MNVRIGFIDKNKRKAEITNTPFLMVTAEAEQASVVKVVQAGVSNLVIKTFKPVTLQDKIEQIFDK